MRESGNIASSVIYASVVGLGDFHSTGGELVDESYTWNADIRRRDQGERTTGSVFVSLDSCGSFRPQCTSMYSITLPLP